MSTHRLERCLLDCQDILLATMDPSSSNLARNTPLSWTIPLCEHSTPSLELLRFPWLITLHARWTSNGLPCGLLPWWFYARTRTPPSADSFFWIPCFYALRSQPYSAGQDSIDFNTRVSALSGSHGLLWLVSALGVSPVSSGLDSSAQHLSVFTLSKIYGTSLEIPRCQR